METARFHHDIAGCADEHKYRDQRFGRIAANRGGTSVVTESNSLHWNLLARFEQ